MRTDLKQFLEQFEENDPNCIRDRRKKSRSLTDLNKVGVRKSIAMNNLAQDVESETLDLMILRLRWCAFCKAEVMIQVEFVNNSKTF